MKYNKYMMLSDRKDKRKRSMDDALMLRPVFDINEYKAMALRDQVKPYVNSSKRDERS